MNLLAIETSTDIASVALAMGSEIQCLEQAGTRQHAQHLLPMIQTLLNDTQVSCAALDGIVFGSGPGSFTGLRIACSIAKAFAYAYDLPLYGLSSMAAIAYQARALIDASTQVSVLAMLDARMQEVYWAYYPPDIAIPDGTIQVSPPQAIQIEDQHAWVLAGWGLDAYQGYWSGYAQGKLIAHYAMYPKADTLIHLTRAGMSIATTAEAALPLYVRNQITHTGGTHG